MDKTEERQVISNLKVI